MNSDNLLGSGSADGLTGNTDLLDTDVFDSPEDDSGDDAVVNLPAEPPAETDALWFRELSNAFTGDSGIGNDAGDTADGGNPYQVICARPAVPPDSESGTGDEVPDFWILPIFDDWIWDSIDLMPVDDAGGSEDTAADEASGGEDSRIGWFDDTEWTDDEWYSEDDGWSDEWDEADWSDDEWIEDDTTGDSGDDWVIEEDTGDFMVIDWGIETGFSEPEIVICPAICILYVPTEEPAFLV